MKRSLTVYWLIPARPEHELFREIIRILAKQFDAPRFEAHLTLFTASQGRQPPSEILCSIKAGPIRLKVRGVGSSSKFTKTLFVRFGPTKSLDRFVVNLARALHLPAKAVNDPHVSLLYKKLSATAKKELASTIKLPFREVVFDSIKAVRCSVPIRNRADIEAWRVVATRRLSG